MDVQVDRVPLGAEKTSVDQTATDSAAPVSETGSVNRSTVSSVTEDVILGGDGIVGVRRAPEGLPGSAPSKEEVVMGILQQMYQTSKNIIDNLKPSEKEIENRRRRQEEIAKLMKLVQDRKIDEEQLRVTLINMLDAEDVGAFRNLIDRAEQVIRG